MHNRDLRAEGWGPEDCYPESDTSARSACYGSSSGEQAAIQTVVTLAKQHGYGNLIDRLRYAWMLQLVESGMSWKSAAGGALFDAEMVNALDKSAREDESALRARVKKYVGLEP